MKPLDLLTKVKDRVTEQSRNFTQEAGISNLRNLPQQVVALDQLVRQSKQETREKAYPGLKSNDPIKRQKAELMSQAQDLAVGATLGTSAPWKGQYAANVAGKLPPRTVEQTIEKQGGWAPGMREKFDIAILTRDVPTIKKLLPHVPEEYLKRGFGPEVYKQALDAARGTITTKPEPITKGVSHATDLLANYSDEIATPGIVSKMVNWFYR